MPSDHATLASDGFFFFLLCIIIRESGGGWIGVVRSGWLKQQNFLFDIP